MVDKGEFHEDYVLHLFRYIFLGINSNFNGFIKITKYYWDTVTEVPETEPPRTLLKIAITW